MVRDLHKTAAALMTIGVLFTPIHGLAQEPAAAPPAPKLPSIVVTQPETRQLVDRIVATGTIKAVEEIYVQPLVDGLSIKSLAADIGDRVEADGILATLNVDALLLQKSQYEANKAKAEAGVAQYQAQLIEAKANLDDAIRQRDRTKKLGSNGTTSISQVEQAQATADVAVARLNAAEQAVTVGEADVRVVESQIADVDLNLARTDVKAPYGGLVASRNAKIGAIAAGASQPLFTIIRDGEIELVADISETDMLRITVGQKAIVKVAGASQALSGSVRLISPTVDATTRLAAVHIAIDDDQRARAGMYGSAEIVIESQEGIALPLSAVNTDKDGSTVRLVNDGIVKQVKIDTGIQDGAYIQVTSGIGGQDEVVAKAGAFVRDGDHINPVRDPAAMSN
ncbi:efflux RND transporter periplasmic adaptor subunit [Rhizobium sp. CG5]|uniref:efflux RND transporter periplasmic adaptor subunit n=1 Tax=Rhizobium sp. CG5 TaxID=2726076 RepID=UPI002033883D|nr:efflux RND transporter periplasmic adaptor subunit [Rhizobium sp. CG5]MCM2473204.1 efflux RND transporter periplasmic adaptor subunit [Rhizobium sp. CG5]